MLTVSPPTIRLIVFVRNLEKNDRDDLVRRGKMNSIRQIVIIVPRIIYKKKKEKKKK